MSEVKKYCASSRTNGGRNFYRIMVLLKSEFVLFRNYYTSEIEGIEIIVNKKRWKLEYLMLVN